MQPVRMTRPASILMLAFFIIAIFPSCKKDLQSAATNPLSSENNPSIPDGYIMTPAGLMKAENVHLIEKGFSLLLKNNHMYKVRSTTKEMISDLGEIHQDLTRSSTPVPTGIGTDGGRNTTPSGGLDGANWVAYSQWTSPQPIMYFSTNWTVPAAPVANNGSLTELLYIWDGISPAPAALPLIQPVLQYGSNKSGNNQGWGGQYWSLTNWCIVSNQQAAFAPAATGISPGTVLQGIINCTGQQPDGSYNYTSSFANYPNQTLTIVEGNQFSNFNAGGTNGNYQQVPAINNAYEVLEAPNRISAANQYPAQYNVAMNSITLRAGTPANNNSPTITAQQFAAGTLGEWVEDVSNNTAGNGLVYLWFSQPPPVPVINGTTNFPSAPSSGSGTIYAAPGHTVTVVSHVYNTAGFYSLYISLNGANFNDGSNFFSFSGSGTYSSYSASKQFVMPPSGSVTWSGSFGSQTSGASGSVSVQ